jgi:hypothetical protein
MAGKFNEPKVKSKVSVTPYPPSWNQESDLDWTSDYPCGVCKRLFRSRRELATHPHPKKGS